MSPRTGARWRDRLASDDLRSLGDLRAPSLHQQGRPARQLPVRHVRRPRTQLARIHASSGTTGKPTVVGYTSADLKTWAGRGPLDPRRRRPSGRHLHITYGYGLFTGGLGIHYGAEYLGCTVVPISGGQTPRQVH